MEGIGVRANIHLGGADRVLPEWIQWGGGGSSRNFPGSAFSGGGVVAEIFRDPYSVGGGGGSSRNFPASIFCEFFPLTAVIDPEFAFFPVNSSNGP